MYAGLKTTLSITQFHKSKMIQISLVWGVKNIKLNPSISEPNPLYFKQSRIL